MVSKQKNTHQKPDTDLAQDIADYSNVLGEFVF